MTNLLNFQFSDRLALGWSIVTYFCQSSENRVAPERVGGRDGLKLKPGHLPANTIVRSHFTDHKGCNRNKFADIWLPDGRVKALSIQGVAILQGFPSWYELPPEAATAGSIIGYSVPPSFAAQLFAHIQKQLSWAIL
ncbi:C-5 cytosine-specific DNA methylase (plasmid) [Anabaenopsis circularis NIES-21]|uniref:C-5 cytosine-specific DNA methylase n=1 Tax=Anabaenopsis circularis NIES-21 TaxID=1085406 RepID=A0A1Z4GRF8_9CYAN|nr:C-5 cytosine-specific DNA methylase [Anabaenopsis circularis NIES-21]